MKKVISFLALSAVLFSVQSCTEDRYVQEVNQTLIGEVFQGTATLTRDDASGMSYSQEYTFSPSIPNSDMILSYRLTNEGTWQLLPVTIPTTSGSLYYNATFTSSKVYITATANFDIGATQSAYITSQTFRFLIIPANLMNKQNQVDKSDYNAVVKAYNLGEANIVTLNP